MPVGPRVLIIMAQIPHASLCISERTDFHLLGLTPHSDDVLAVWIPIHPTPTAKSIIGEHDEEEDCQLDYLLGADSTSPSLVTF